jgi:hypothetical protein
MTIKLTLFDNDHVIRAETDVALKEQNDMFRKFLQEIKEELATGQTEYLEIEGFEKNPITFEISQFE